MKNSNMNKIFSVLCSILIFCGTAFAVEDDFVNKTLAQKAIERPQYLENYNFEDTTAIPIKLSIASEVGSEKDLYEGQILEFITVERVKYDGKTLIRKGTPVTARVETIIANGMNGIPASVIIGNFNIPGIESSRLTAEYEKYGFDLSLLVFPLKWALTPLPPTGSLTNFIKGGHVKLKPDNIITIYYHPNWL